MPLLESPPDQLAPWLDVRHDSAMHKLQPTQAGPSQASQQEDNIIAYETSEHLEHVSSDVPDRFDTMESGNSSIHLRDMVSSPNASELLEERFEHSISRNRSNRCSWSQQRELDDLWYPEPPLSSEPQAYQPWSFLDSFDQGTATLTFNDANGNHVSIHGLDAGIISVHSAIIAAAFETSDNHGSQLHLDLLSQLTVEPFVRFLYTGSYDDGVAYNAPTSLLLHCQLYYLASVFEIGKLHSEALLNVLRQCEFACSSAEQPIDLCAALRFCYHHVDDNRRLIDEIVEYCIQQFTTHKLGNDEEFKSLAFDHRPFHRDLANACRRRGFEDEAAIDIIRMPFDSNSPDHHASTEDFTNPRLQDVVGHFHHSDAFEDRDRDRRRSRQPVRARPATRTLTLALRGREAQECEHDAGQSASEDEYQMVDAESGTSTPTTLNEFVLVMRPAQGVEGSVQQSDSFNEAPLAALTDMTRERDRTDSDAASLESEWTMA